MESFKGEGCGRHVLDAASAAREHMGQGGAVKGPSSGRPCGSSLPFSIRFAVGMAFSPLYTLFQFSLRLFFFFSLHILGSLFSLPIDHINRHQKYRIHKTKSSQSRSVSSFFIVNKINKYI